MKKKPAKPKVKLSEVVAPDHKPVIPFAATADFEAWLAEHHHEHSGLWIRFFKADSGYPSITYAEALDVALCFGWIDGPIRKADEVSWIHKFTPRGKRSVWSQKNKTHIERLTKAGRMQPAGLAAVAAAKADGRWDAAYASPANFVESPEFMAALKKSRQAAKFYATLSNTNKYAFYYRLHTVKKAETKAKKITEFIGMLERGETFH
jgi:uncharacterized protein YdeI (YjbR/CyaY-like superfamily)